MISILSISSGTVLAATRHVCFLTCSQTEPLKKSRPPAMTRARSSRAATQAWSSRLPRLLRQATAPRSSTRRLKAASPPATASARQATTTDILTSSGYLQLIIRRARASMRGSHTRRFSACFLHIRRIVHYSKNATFPVWVSYFAPRISRSCVLIPLKST